MKKIMIGLAAAAIAISPLSVNIVNANLDAQPTYDNLTEKASFYRVTRGFVSPLLELDNNVNTKIEFTKGKYLTYMDYIFVDDIFVNRIEFVSNDSQYQRILLLENGQIRQQYDLAKYPDGVIPVNFDAQKIDSIKVQFNGVEGSYHSLAELEIIGTKATTTGASKPSGDSTLVTPEVIDELVAVEEEDTTGTGDGVPTEPAVPPVEEDNGGETGTGDGEPVTPEAPPVDEDNGTDPIPSDGEPVVNPPVEEDNSGDIGTGEGTATPPGEEEEEVKDENTGDTDYVENGETDEEETPEVPEEGDVVVVPETPEAPGEGSEVVVPEEEETEVTEPTVPEEPVTPEPPVVEEPEVPVEEEPEVVIPPVVVETPVDFCSAHPLTPSVFKSKKDYSVYSVNAASMKLLSHNHYNESYFLKKLSNSKIVMNGKVYSAKEFVGILKVSKYKNVKVNNVSKSDCDVKSNHNSKKDVDKKKDVHKHSSKADKNNSKKVSYKKDCNDKYSYKTPVVSSSKNVKNDDSKGKSVVSSSKEDKKDNKKSNGKK